jgi:CheY-like chemotaxis protein
MPASSVLVAEDEQVARTSLVELLEAEGFHVLAAEDGEQALSLILREEPDTVLLDIRMPRLDGLSVLRQALKGGSDSTFIVMTAYNPATLCYTSLTSRKHRQWSSDYFRLRSPAAVSSSSWGSETCFLPSGMWR